MRRVVLGLTICTIASGAAACGNLPAEVARNAAVVPVRVPVVTEPEPEIRRGLLQKSAPVDCGKAKCIALTFDDGPMEDTDRLLRMLAEYDAKATFFVVGQMVKEDPSMVRKEVAGGHEIGNHSWSHANLAVMSTSGIRSQLSRTQEAVERAAGVTPVLLRPPYGATNRNVASVARSFHMPQILWQVDPEDWKYRDSSTVARRVLSGAHRGDVVLMHDIHPTTISAVPRILASLAGQGYRFVTVSELFADRKFKPGSAYEQR
ncbi:MAG: polysaccharide deacetylase family protein [Streptosporangiaceae bacterium]